MPSLHQASALELELKPVPSQKPLMIELFAGLHGWGAGAVEEGFRVVGFDLFDMCGDLGIPKPAGDIRLVLQDVLTIHGAQFKDADLIVASPPCQAYSYRAMPWSRAKALPPPDNSLFEACFRIQREACEASGRYIPLVVENVRGAQTWVGRARWHFGSFYLWGDVPALMPMARSIKNTGGSWFNIAHNTTSGHGRNPDGRKLPSENGRRTDIGNGVRFTSLDCGIEGIKQHGSGREWFAGDGKISRLTSSKSPARKAASAMIAKIPLVLSRHIAAAWKPDYTSVGG